MSAAWITVLALFVTTAAVRAAGPLAMGGRDLHPRLRGVVDLLAPALLTALIVVETLGEDGALELSASLAGVAAAAGVLSWRRSAVLGAITAAAVTTALLRAI